MFAIQTVQSGMTGNSVSRVMTECEEENESNNKETKKNTTFTAYLIKLIIEIPQALNFATFPAKVYKIMLM